ncbi:MAG: hypothetical protein WCC87_13900 [Candidatus Korobacteraceae bacterium]
MRLSSIPANEILHQGKDLTGLDKSGQKGSYLVKTCSSNPTMTQKGVTSRKENNNPWGNCKLAAASLGVHVRSAAWYALLNSGSRVKSSIT